MEPHFVKYSLCTRNWIEALERLSEAGNSLVAQSVKNLPAMQETQVRSLGWEDPLEKEMATHSSILAWKISRTWTRCPILDNGVSRVRHDLATKPPQAFPRACKTEAESKFCAGIQQRSNSKGSSRNFRQDWFSRWPMNFSWKCNFPESTCLG